MKLLPDRRLILRRLLHRSRLGDQRVARRADFLHDLSQAPESLQFIGKFPVVSVTLCPRGVGAAVPAFKLTVVCAENLIRAPPREQGINTAAQSLRQLR
jgi:hypothetical protein